MRIHFNISDIPHNYKVFKHADKIAEPADNEEFLSVDYYIVVDDLFYNTDKEYKYAWFKLADLTMDKLHWLILNQICFSASH